ncbi:hypothetical protein J1N35_037767 [Gossypium stocksii]|uniref:Uncharacterized protein n=1 Tax=Gossypium stocksii TaxID=47602 RepID=A0A9D3ZM06_9ROSI|nr:hypothetical protein J1N35_037767 [Gossypium stocksii]
METLQECLTSTKKDAEKLHGELAGPFDARRVNFDALSELTSTQLDFYVNFPSRTAWEEFATKWKNSSNFYIVDVVETRSALEDSVGTSAIHADGNEDNECTGDDE